VQAGVVVLSLSAFRASRLFAPGAAGGGHNVRSDGARESRRTAASVVDAGEYLRAAPNTELLPSIGDDA
jgi:hypothetical protein